MTGLALAVCLAQGSHQVDTGRFGADYAIKKSKDFLANLGAKQLTLTQFGLLDKNITRTETYWVVQFEASNRHHQNCYAEIRANDGQVMHAEFGDWTIRSPDNKSTVKAKAEEFALRSMRKLVPSAKVQLRSINHAKPITVADFDVLVNGKRFYNFNPGFGYDLMFNVDTWTVNRFYSTVKIPPIDARKVTVKPDVAKEIAVKQLDTVPINVEQRRVFKEWGTWFTKVSTEAGYFKVDSETQARNVWMCTVTTAQDQKNFGIVQRGTYHFMVDAVTGEVVL
jgi:hypothetical protein